MSGRCYRSVSVYANTPERLALWNVFFVEPKATHLLVQVPEFGKAISLQTGRVLSYPELGTVHPWPVSTG